VVDANLPFDSHGSFYSTDKSGCIFIKGLYLLDSVIQYPIKLKESILHAATILGLSAIYNSSYKHIVVLQLFDLYLRLLQSGS